jgi:predicted DNA-binding transcriptional regulator AlpA
VRERGPDVVSSPQVCELLGGISRQRLSQLADRDGFPAHRDVPSAGYRGSTRVWDRAEIVAWQQARTIPKRRPIRRVLREYDRGHRTIPQIALLVGVHKTTAYRWLRELGRLD